MGAVVLNGAKIGARSLVGAGALVTEGKEFPENSLIVGAPARASARSTRRRRNRCRSRPNGM
jgi:carbonic anhydrase/acetyltransferase-like protein (isoleucine patch superfamily)